MNIWGTLSRAEVTARPSSEARRFLACLWRGDKASTAGPWRDGDTRRSRESVGGEVGSGPEPPSACNMWATVRFGRRKSLEG